MLVAVLLLIALVTILVVAGSMLAQVERRVASTLSKTELARQNALLALDIAVGQLQATAGPDQRITARAEILDAASTQLRNTVVKQPLWTGVWVSGNASLDVVNSGTPQRKTSFQSAGANATMSEINASAVWLVSRATPSGTVDPVVGPTGKTIDLAKSLGNASLTVTVPLASITSAAGQTVGRYGYWVSDEGVKAKVNIKDPTLKIDGSGATQVDPVNDLAKNQLHFGAPQAMAAHKILPGTLAADFRQANQVDQVLTPQALPLLPSVAPSGYVSNRYLPDITTYSYGVFSDVRNGGLRKDLTAALEDSGNTAGRNYDKLNPLGMASVYQAKVDGIVPAAMPLSALGLSSPLQGLRWINLFSYYNLYKATMPSVKMTGQTLNPDAVRPAGVGDPGNSNRPYAVSPRAICWKDGTGGNTFDEVLAPICLGVRYDFAISTRKDAASGNYTLQSHYFPAIVLYNPYTVSIQSANYRYGRAFQYNSFGSLLKVQSGNATYYTNLVQPNSNARIQYSTQLDSSNLAPGEIRVFGLAAASPVAVASGNYYNNSLADACQFRGNATTSGLVSVGYAPSAAFCQTTDLLYNSTTSNGTMNAGDRFDPLPAMPDGNVTLSLTHSGYCLIGQCPYVDVGIPGRVSWPTSAPGGGEAMPALTGMSGSDGRRYMQTSSPGSNDTGLTLNGSNPPLTTTLSQLNGSPRLVGSLFQRKKGLVSTSSNYSNQSYQVPNFTGNSEGFDIFNDTFSASNWDELYVPTTAGFVGWAAYPPPSLSMQLGLSGNDTTTSWGNHSTGVDFPDGSRIVLADVPVQPLISLGQFMHMKPLHFSGIAAYKRMSFGSMFVGGSYSNPAVPLQQTVYDSAGATVPGAADRQFLFCDNSFLANQALFDSYFFSTVPPSSLPAAVSSAPNAPDMSPVRPSVYPAFWTDFNAANPGTTLQNDSVPFLNSRIVPYRKNDAPPVLADLRDMDKASANLWLNGAFNINSTSVDAWRALLSSLSGNDLSLWNASTQSAITLAASDLKNPIPRFWSTTGNATLDQAWCGVRALSDTQITDLATKIVAQVKARGPFLSLADFLNRRLGATSTDMTRAGALQAAIDTTSPDINATAKAAGTAMLVDTTTTGTSTLAGTGILAFSGPLPIFGNMMDASSSTGTKWNTALGIPGYLMQQDLVQAFSPVMAARSDTFVIRTYGESVNPATGKVDGSAYGEAVVQRLPEYVDQSDPSLTTAQAGYTIAVGDATPPVYVNANNKTLGRRFKIVSFRWLSPDEI